jgi:hypothetical protein
MARFVATDYNIKLNGVDYSQSIAAVTLDITSESQDVTAFGGSGFRTRIGGLKDASVTLDWHSDFGASGIDSVLFPLIGAQATVTVKPTSGSVSSTNPSYEGVFIVEGYSPMASSIGDLATFSTTWALAGTAGITRGTV